MKPETVGGSPAVMSLPLRLTKTIPTDFERFNFRLLLSAHISTLLISAKDIISRYNQICIICILRNEVVLTNNLPF